MLVNAEHIDSFIIQKNCHNCHNCHLHETEPSPNRHQPSPNCHHLNQQQADAYDSCDGGDSSAPTLLGGGEIMRLIGEHIKKYGGREDDRAFSLISARIEDQGYDPDMVAYCIKRWREGHRIFVSRGDEV